jgi:hypothetical protein
MVNLLGKEENPGGGWGFLLAGSSIVAGRTKLTRQLLKTKFSFVMCWLRDFLMIGKLDKRFCWGIWRKIIELRVMIWCGPSALNGAGFWLAGTAEQAAEKGGSTKQNVPQGLKPSANKALLARLKPCP